MPSVLIVEDEPELAGLLGDVLSASGYDVVLTTAGQAADRIEKGQPSVVVLDYLMPGRSGAEVVWQLRERLGTAVPPVLLVTGLHNAPELAEQIGAQAFLRKPFDVDAFVRVVGELAQAPRT
jgi:two-component system phosphate regulon response regulator PhoB